MNPDLGVLIMPQTCLSCSWTQPGTAGWPPTHYLAACPAEALKPGDKGPEYPGTNVGQAHSGCACGKPGVGAFLHLAPQAPVDPGHKYRVPMGGQAQHLPTHPSLADTSLCPYAFQVPRSALCFPQSPQSTSVASSVPLR